MDRYYRKQILMLGILQITLLEMFCQFLKSINLWLTAVNRFLIFLSGIVFSVCQCYNLFCRKCKNQHYLNLNTSLKKILTFVCYCRPHLRRPFTSYKKPISRRTAIAILKSFILQKKLFTNYDF